MSKEEKKEPEPKKITDLLKDDKGKPLTD